ncbi:MAG: hypothetical protein LBD37_03605 [Treponema sp.]|jgi:tellurite resistance protein TehA-like permease|nr:hypothetical protein [Treponema sp.]
MSVLLILALTSSLSLNLLLGLGLGARELVREPDRPWSFALVRGALLFFTILLLWLVFTLIFTPLGLGFFEYLLILPLIALIGRGCDALRGFVFSRPPLGRKIGVSGDPARLETSAVDPFMPSGYYGLILMALALVLRLAQSFGEALALALGFTLGYLFSARLIRAVHTRTRLESPPSFLRGLPLWFISMGLLGMILSALERMFLLAFRFF